MTTLDEFDKKILAILQVDNHTRQRDIAEQVCLSAAAVHRRIKRMEEEKIIIQNSAVLDPPKVGRPTTVIVGVEIESEQVELLDKMKATFSSLPEVQQCYYTTGQADFILIISVKDMKEYESLTRQIFFAEKNVKKFTTFVVMDQVKVTLAVPIK